jgi:uncharacterized protein with HEPN domain
VIDFLVEFCPLDITKKFHTYLQDILDACIVMEDVIVGVTFDEFRHNSTVLMPSNLDVAINTSGGYE